MAAREPFESEASATRAIQAGFLHPRSRCFGGVLVLLALMLPGCGSQGDGTEASYARNLFARAPDQVIEQPGVIVPAKDGTFGSYGLDGWFGAKVNGGPSEAVAWASVLKARVRLPMLAPFGTTLRLRLCAPPGIESGATEARVRLNGEELGAVALEPALGTFEFATSTGQWRRGNNLIEFVTTKLGEAAEEKQVSIGVARIEYGKEIPATLRDGGARLRSGCALVYGLEWLTDTVLEAGGVCDGDGRLDVKARSIDPHTGQQINAFQTESIPCRDGQVRGTVVLPDPGEGTLEIEIGWSGATADSGIDLNRLLLHEVGFVERPPIVFISIDTLSAQHLSIYGYPRKTTPHLEGFLADAILFTKCRANAPWTIPSYMSQFTGLIPRSHQIEFEKGLRLEPTPWEKEQIATSRWTLAECLRGAGFDTAAFVDNPWLARGFGFRQGFDHYDVSASEIDLQDTDGGIRHVTSRALDWLDQRGSETPFFLFAQAFDTHAPYFSSAPWKGSFAGDGLIEPSWRVPVGRKQAFSYGCIPDHIASAYYKPKDCPRELAVAPIADAYDEKILEVDAGVGRFLEALKERGLYDECLIIFSADHGESTLGHDFFFNHALLYGDVLHVPLLVKMPHQEGAGRVVDAPVQLVDLYPTLLELVSQRSRRGSFHGTSFLGALRGETLGPRTLFAEGGMMEQYAVEREGWKLIASRPLRAGYQTQLTHPKLDRRKLAEIVPELGQGFFSNSEIAKLLDAQPAARKFLAESLKGEHLELYYLPDDPAELHDLAGSKPEIVRDLLPLIVQSMVAGDAARSKDVFQNAPVELTRDEIQDLKDLGYYGEE